jgi:hypothetical protein
LVAARAARTTTSANKTVPLTPINSFREFKWEGYSIVFISIGRPASLTLTVDQAV